jgi:hypothetical protein
MFALMAHGRNGGQFLAAVCSTKEEAVAIAGRIGGLRIIGPLASVIIPHVRWRLCQLRTAEGLAGGRCRVISATADTIPETEEGVDGSSFAGCRVPGDGRDPRAWVRRGPADG